MPIQEAPYLRSPAIQDRGLPIIPAAVQKRDKVDALEHKIDDNLVHEYSLRHSDPPQSIAPVCDVERANESEDQLQVTSHHCLEEDDEYV